MKKLLSSILLTITIGLMSIHLVDASGGKCTNSYIDQTYLLESPDVLKGLGGYCNFLKYGSCCSEEYLNTELNRKYTEFKETLYMNYTLMIDHYSAWMSKVVDFQNNQTQESTAWFEEMYTLALQYAHRDHHNPIDHYFKAVDDQADLLELCDRTYHQVVDNFDMCADVVLQHLAGQMCLYCDPFFINNFKYNEFGFIEIGFDYNVCYEFQRNCYKYIEGRNLMSGLKNIIIMLERLYQIPEIIQEYFDDQNFANKQKFAKALKDVATDEIQIPPLCYSEFTCPWACDNMVGIYGLDIDKIINPTDIANYSYTDSGVATWGTGTTARLLEGEYGSASEQDQSDHNGWIIGRSNSIEVGKELSGLDWTKIALNLHAPELVLSSAIVQTSIGMLLCLFLLAFSF